MRPLEEIVQLLRAPHGAGKPAQVDAAELLEAQARKIADLQESLAEVEFLLECATRGGA
jgi:hypothetical protein